MLGLKRNGATVEPEPVLEPTPEPTPPTRDELVRSLSVMTDDEFRSIAEEARGPQLVPLAELVVEGLSDTINKLARQLGDEVTIDDVGRAAVTRDTVKRLIAEQAAKREHQREVNRQKAAEFKRARAERQAAHAARMARRDRGMVIPPPEWSDSDALASRARSGFSR